MSASCSLCSSHQLLTVQPPLPATAAGIVDGNADCFAYAAVKAAAFASLLQLLHIDTAAQALWTAMPTGCLVPPSPRWAC